jgi:hypothetical protein
MQVSLRQMACESTMIARIFTTNEMNATAVRYACDGSGDEPREFLH